jgi:phosphatidylglycerophosphate synthase
MTRIGVLLAPEAMLASLRIGGLTMLERQARMLSRIGCTRLLLVGAPPLTPVPAGAEVVRNDELPGLLAAVQEVVLIAQGLVIDERALAAVMAAPGPAMLVSDGHNPAPPAQSRGVERLDAHSHAAGILRLDAAMVSVVAATLGDWDLGSTLIRSAVSDPRIERVSIDAIALYSAERRREVPLLWALPQDAQSARTASDAVVAAAQKGCLDWPARFLHPFIEDALVRLLAPTGVTPNMVTLATGVVGLAAGWAFATGALWWGLGLALLCGPLDGVDGKLARTRIEFSRWGDLEHGLDKVLEYGWYLAAAFWFASARGTGLPWAVAALIILPALAEAVQGEFYRRMTGMQLDDSGRFERAVRLVAGRRNTFLWSWVIFSLFGLWFEGFVVLAVYSVLTTAVAQWRFYKRLGAFAREGDARARSNFAATRYDFLAKASLPSDLL